MATISSDIVARYAADAAREVDGVRSLVQDALHRHKGVRVLDQEQGLRVELHLAVEWGVSIPEIGAAVQARVGEYLRLMAEVEPARVDVVVDEIGPPQTG
jgi:uncharacterized alkaline shock family protein YloU